MHHRDLNVWKESIKLVKKAYSLSADFPTSEQFGLTSQLRRAVVSIPSNIAEGSERQSKREFAQFLYIAKGSCAELRTQLYIAAKIGAMPLETVNKLADDAKHISSMLHNLINFISSNVEH